MRTGRMYTNRDGKSRYEDILIPWTHSGTKPAVTVDAYRSNFGVTWDRKTDYHHAAQQQLLVVLTGWLDITTSDGLTEHFFPGDFFFATDMTGDGHITTTGDECTRARIFVTSWMPQRGVMQNTPQVPAEKHKVRGKYVHLYTEPDGNTHFKDLEGLFPPKGTTGFKAHLFELSAARFRGGASERSIHHSRGRQVAMFLSGQEEVTASDGNKRTFTTGDILVVDDFKGKGHASKTSPDGRSIVLALKDESKVPGVNA